MPIIFISMWFSSSSLNQHSILDRVETIQTNMDEKHFSCGFFIDLKKAFDTESQYVT